MDELLHVHKNEHGMVRVFTADLTSEDREAILNPPQATKPTGAALGALLGLDWIDPTKCDLFDVADLEGLGLVGFLRQGAGISEAVLAQHRKRLEALSGAVFIVYSQAFKNSPLDLTPDPRVRPILVLSEEKPPIQFETLPSASAQGQVAATPNAPANPHLNVLWAILALPILALLIGAVLWAVL